ncbi:MAG TPA: imidazolonepropionase [Thermohalobaculum sp.]|nr:imidazolonepropionase [Thermohalobaculum sp.]
MTAYALAELTAATMTPGDEPYGLIEDALIAVADGRIAWIGPREDAPRDVRALPVHKQDGRLATPGLIDCHTHIVHGGDRAREFEMRLEGATYEEIARAGGGIVSTVRATRAADEDELVETALPRLDTLIAEGVTTIEVKSGYGLDIATELAMLRAARRLAAKRDVEVLTSFLGAHAVPPELKADPDAYIDEVCIPALEAAAEEDLADAVDGFCEGIAFTPEQIARVFDRAVDLGLPVKLHAEQLSNLGGAQLAASYGALSADHLEYLDDAGVRAMAAAGTVAVLLPGAFYTLRETHVPPVATLREHGVPMAVATDCNPGSSPLTSLLMAMNMACTLLRLTPEEALAGTTRVAARALGLDDRGILAEGTRADIAIWDAAHPAELSYRIGFNPLHHRIFGGTR